MFGTVALLKPKPGQEAAVVEHFNLWWRERAPKANGALMGTLNREVSNPAQLMLSTTFSSKAAYEANANHPEQDAWYRQLITFLEEEPKWIDGDVLSVHSRGAM